jgi:myo-inositol 2-dehydrogenase/D-chiro-inositol 1-dehydrogenase
LLQGPAKALEKRLEVNMARIGVFGCGRIGRMHALNIARHPRTELVSVFDVVEESARQTAEATGATAVSSIEAITEDDKIDAVLIASSTDTHVDLLTLAAKSGKAILCEKPIDLDMNRVKSCWAEIKSLDPVVMIGFNRRFDPTFQELRRRLSDGVVGKLEQLTITSRDPGPPPAAYIKVSGGLFRDMTIHDFDLARYFAGDIVDVHATGANLVEPEIEALGDIDSAMITMRTASGALIHISNSRRAVYGYDQRIEAFGERGMLQAGNQRDTSLSFWGSEGTDVKSPIMDFFIERYAPAYLAEIDHFVDCIEKGDEPGASFEDGLEALRLADAALESMSTGQTVKLD